MTVNSAKMVSVSSMGNGAMIEHNIQISKNTVMDGGAPMSSVSRTVESRFGLLEQKMVLKASSMRCDSLDTDAYEDAPDTLETCSIGGSIEEFDMFQSPTDTSMGHDGGRQTSTLYMCLFSIFFLSSSLEVNCIL